MKRIYTLILSLFSVVSSIAQHSHMQIVDRIGHVSVISAENIGTAFVSTLDAKVLGFSETPYDKNMELPDGFRFWLEAANDAIENGYEMTSTTRSNVIPIQVDPFIMTKWGQNKPYNNKCPKVGSNRTITGCVATSLAQICKYYQYPSNGKGSAKYYISNSVNGKIAAFGDIFDYANMLDSYIGIYNTVQADAVAVLMRDCGYAATMNYGLDESGANYKDAANGMVENLGYNDRSLKWLNRMFYTDEEWKDMIYTELMEHRPVMYSGQDPKDGGGHSFLFDGLQPDGYVHINWGWDGQMNGFYDIDVMHSNANYIEGQMMIIGLKPFKATETTPYEYSPVVVIDEAKILSEEKTLKFEGGIYNYDFRDLVGDIAMVYYNKTTPEKSDTLFFLREEWVNEDGTIERDSLPAYRGWRFSDDKDSNPILEINQYFDEETDAFTPGEYETYFIVRASFEEEYSKARTEGGEWFATFTVADDGVITITNESTTTTSLPDVWLDAKTGGSKTYNLNGQVVPKATKGLVIRDGKKLMQR